MLKKISCITLVFTLVFMLAVSTSAETSNVNVSIDYLTNKVTVLGETTAQGMVTCLIENPNKSFEFIDNKTIINGSYSFSFEILNPVNGIYNGKIKIQNTNESVDFQFGYDSSNFDDYGNTYQTAHLISTGQTEGRINYSDDIDIFKFIPEFDGEYKFEIQTSRYNEAKIYSTEDFTSPLIENDNSLTNSDFEILAELSANHTYYLEMDGEIGDYTITISLIKPSKNLNAIYSDDMVTIKGFVNGETTKQVLIRILNPDNGIEMIDQIISDSTGCFSFSHKILNPINGTYQVLVSIEGGPSVHRTSFDVTYDTVIKSLILESGNFLSIPDVSTVYSVDGILNAPNLIANAELNTVSSVTNNSDAAQKIMASVGLYDANNNLLKYTTSSALVGSGDTKELSNIITLPSVVAGCEAKVFITEGGDFYHASMIPLANGLIIPRTEDILAKPANQTYSDDQNDILTINALPTGNIGLSDKMSILEIQTSDNNLGTALYSVATYPTLEADISFSYKGEYCENIIKPGEMINVSFRLKNTGTQYLDIHPCVKMLHISGTLLTFSIYIGSGGLEPGEESVQDIGMLIPANISLFSMSVGGFGYDFYYLNDISLTKTHTDFYGNQYNDATMIKLINDKDCIEATINGKIDYIADAAHEHTDVDYISFIASEGGAYEVSTTGIDMHAEVFSYDYIDEDNLSYGYIPVLPIEEFSTQNKRLFNLESGEKYTLKLSAAIASATGEYTCTITNKDDYGNTLETSFSIEIEQKIYGKINYATDTDVFKLIITNGGSYSFEAISNKNMQMALYSESNLSTPIVSGTLNEDKSNLTVDELPSGMYYIFVSSEKLAEYSVKVTVENFDIFEFDLELEGLRKNIKNLIRFAYDNQDTEKSMLLNNKYEELFQKDLELHQLPDSLRNYPKASTDYDIKINGYYRTLKALFYELKAEYTSIISDENPEDPMASSRLFSSTEAEEEIKDFLEPLDREPIVVSEIEESEAYETNIPVFRAPEETAIKLMSNTPSIELWGVGTNRFEAKVKFPESGANGNIVVLIDYSNGRTTKEYLGRIIENGVTSPPKDGYYTYGDLTPGGFYMIGLYWSRNGGVTSGGQNAIYKRVQLVTEGIPEKEQSIGQNIITNIETRDFILANTANFNTWLGRMDKTYDDLYELTGSKQYSGKISMNSVYEKLDDNPNADGYPFVAARAGNPIRWLRGFMRSQMIRLSENDWGRIGVHELSHDLTAINGSLRERLWQSLRHIML